MVVQAGKAEYTLASPKGVVFIGSIGSSCCRSALVACITPPENAAT